ncbi:MAG TPA: hypothetical protein VMV53_04145 [Acidimicrobiales bacterium]|nr:hypothetical protein [Acidimicrobiales bacterium]
MVAPTLRCTAAGFLVTDVDCRLGEGTCAAIAGRRTLVRAGTVVLEVVLDVVLDVVVDVVVEVVLVATDALFASMARRSVDGAGVLARGVTSTEASCVIAGDEVVVEPDERIAETGNADVNSTRPPTTVTSEPSAARRRPRRRGVRDELSTDEAALAVIGETSTTASSKPFVYECPCVFFIRTIFEIQNHLALYDIPKWTQLLLR